MIVRSVSVLALALFGLLLTGGLARAERSVLEDLDPAIALASISQMRGVVFVDLYADW
jgi:hypothetical protein